jgi:hypothetical protein
MSKRDFRVNRELYRNAFAKTLSDKIAEIDEETLDERISDICWTMFEEIHRLDWEQYRSVIDALKASIQEAEEKVPLEDIKELETLANN